MDLEEIEKQIETLRGEQAAIHYRAEEQIDDIQQKIGLLERQARRITRLNTHGTPARYMRGCRCDDCRAAMSGYQRERAEARKEGDYRGVVPADVARAPLEQCKAAGVSMNLLSRLVNVDSFYLHGVRTGNKKNIRADFEAKILSCTPEFAAGERKVRTKPVRLYIEALEQRGFSLPQIAKTSGVDETKLGEIKTHSYIETRIERAVLAVQPH